MARVIALQHYGCETLGAIARAWSDFGLGQRTNCLPASTLLAASESVTWRRGEANCRSAAFVLACGIQFAGEEV